MMSDVTFVTALPYIADKWTLGTDVFSFQNALVKPISFLKKNNLKLNSKLILNEYVDSNMKKWWLKGLPTLIFFVYSNVYLKFLCACITSSFYILKHVFSYFQVILQMTIQYSINFICLHWRNKLRQVFKKPNTKHVYFFYYAFLLN